jgi:hypothetical protein
MRSCSTRMVVGPCYACRQPCAPCWLQVKTGWRTVTARPPRALDTARPEIFGDRHSLRRTQLVHALRLYPALICKLRSFGGRLLFLANKSTSRDFPHCAGDSRVTYISLDNSVHSGIKGDIYTPSGLPCCHGCCTCQKQQLVTSPRMKPLSTSSSSAFRLSVGGITRRSP